nr:recombinase family protein [Streptomyces sp. SID8499]
MHRAQTRAHDGPSAAFHGRPVGRGRRRKARLSEVRRPARLAVPLARRRGGLRLPHPPLHPGAPAEEGAAGADPGRLRTGPAVAAGHPAASAHRPGPAERGHPHRVRSALGQELDSQLDALSKHGIPREKIFSEKISTRVRVRPRFEEALCTTREFKAHAPPCRVIFTVCEMKRLGRDAAELTRSPTTSPPTAWSWRCSPGPCLASTAPPGRGNCCSRTSPRWRRPSGRTCTSRRCKGSIPRPARASTAAGSRSSPTTCSTPC